MYKKKETLKSLIYILTLQFLMVISLTGCDNSSEELLDDDNEDEQIDDDYESIVEYGDGWYDSMPNGGKFLRANTVRFYYIDKRGNDLIDPDDVNTLPVTSDVELDDATELRQDYNKETIGFYNKNRNSICYDSEEQLYYSTIYAYGDSRQSSYTFFVYANDNVDKLTVRYKHTDKDIVGGDSWSTIISWRYNGEHIYSDEEKVYYKKIFITRDNGKTSVSFSR